MHVFLIQKLKSTYISIIGQLSDCFVSNFYFTQITCVLFWELTSLHSLQIQRFGQVIFIYLFYHIPDQAY
jgi:hypothetical protein